MRVPIGVTASSMNPVHMCGDAASLCLKSGNAVVMRGGSEAIESNAAMVRVIQRRERKNGIPREL